MKRICREESFHQRQGFDILVTLCRGSDAQRAMAQDALDRWWWPSLMMFGPNDDASPNSERSMRWRIKRFSNDELRQRFVDATVPQAQFLGLRVPDDELAYDETAGHWTFGEPDWDEFRRVLNGDGPMNAQRLAHRKRAYDNGDWVLDAAEAHAAKHAATTAA
jgi:ring-1,2-phenylacetyl-CoA epoxidase subunit PaaA